MRRLLLAVLVVAFPVSGAEVAVPSVTVPTPTSLRLLIDRFQLFPKLSFALSTAPEAKEERLLHLTGDPDALLTLGDLASGQGFCLKAAVELNDVVLRALAPDERVKSDDTRQRAAGDYRALDASGRPYQFRFGARLVW